MNGRPDVAPPAAPLVGAEGELITIGITVEPRRLEALLDALSRLDFPVNPQIYHRACVVRVQADGREDEQPAVMVEFPAYSNRLPQIYTALESLHLPAHAVGYMPVLPGLRQRFIATPAPSGSSYRMIIRYRSFADRARARPADPNLQTSPGSDKA